MAGKEFGRVVPFAVLVSVADQRQDGSFVLTDRADHCIPQVILLASNQSMYSIPPSKVGALHHRVEKKDDDS
jgi:hypothetical protein